MLSPSDIRAGKRPRLVLAAALALATLGATISLAAEEKLSRLQGTARLTRTQDVIGAAVLVQRDGDPNTFHLTSTNQNGKFFIDGLRDGDYSVHLNREGLAPDGKDGISIKYPFRAVVEVTMEAGTAELEAPNTPTSAGGSVGLRGSVLGPDGTGLGEVWVRIVKQDGSVDPISLRTPEDGSFGFSDLPAGEWRVEVIGIGYLPLRQRLNFGSDSDLFVRLVLQPPEYIPSPLDLLPPEAPIAPEGFR